MPNNTENHLHVICEDDEEHKRFLEAVYEDKETPLSFDRVLGIPSEDIAELVNAVMNDMFFYIESVKISLSITDKNFSLENKSDEEILRLYFESHKKSPWYGWNNLVYGTKWNSYDFFHYNHLNPYITEYGFYTAWDSPYEGLVNLSRKFPKHTFINEWLDEHDGVWGASLVCGKSEQHCIHTKNAEGVELIKQEKKWFLAEFFESA